MQKEGYKNSDTDKSRNLSIELNKTFEYEADKK